MSESAVDTLVQEVCDLFPEETKKYKGLIRTCVEGIIASLPNKMTEGQYVQMVRDNIQLVRDGKL